MSVDLNEYEMAIMCAFNCAGVSTADINAREMQARATSYCDSVKQLADSWKYHFEVFKVSKHQQVKFYGLQAIQEALERSTYGADVIDATSRQELRVALLIWMRDHLADIQEAAFLKNKLAVVFTHLIRLDFPDRWLNAFHDILGLCSHSDFELDLYLRILQSIHQDVVEFPAQRSAEDSARNGRVKDAMRETPVIRDSLAAMFRVLVKYIEASDKSSGVALVQTALETLKEYISWIDINLVMDEQFMRALFTLLGDTGVQNIATNCVSEIVRKGMDSKSKLALMQQLNILQVLHHLDITSSTNIGHSGVHVNKVEIHDEFAVEIAELIDAVGLQLIDCLNTAQDAEMYSTAAQMLTELMPMIWSCFGHETKDVSEEVLDVVNALVGFLKGDAKVPAGVTVPFQVTPSIPQLLFGITRQIRYPEDSSFGSWDQDEAEFELYRRNLRKIFINVSRYETKAVLEFMCTTTSQALPQFHTMSPADLEVLLALAYHFGEAISTGAGRPYMTEGPFPEMIVAIHNRILQLQQDVVYPPTVLLTYLDLIVRYTKMICDKPDLISALLGRILGPFGIMNQHAHVRSRAAYLLLRFVKNLAGNVQDQHVGQILQGIQSFLEVPKESDEERKGVELHLSFEDQLYLFEIAGLLIGSHGSLKTDSVRQMQYLEAVLAPQVTSMEQATQLVTQSNVNLETIATWQGRVLGAVSHVMKGFKSHIGIAHQQIFGSILKVAIRVLNGLAQFIALRRKTLFLLHRMIIVMEKELIQYLPSLLDVFVCNCVVEDTMETIQFINQLMVTYVDEMYPILNSQIMTIIQRLCAIMPDASATTSQKLNSALQNTVGAMTSADIDRSSVQKYLYLFLFNVSTIGKLNQVLCTAQNIPHLQSLLELIYQGAADSMDISIQRTSFAVITNFIEKWTCDQGLIEPQVQQAMMQYVVTQFAPATFAIVRQKRFNFKDAQCNLLIKEVLRLQKVLIQLGGVGYIDLLSSSILPSFGASPEAAATYVAKLKVESSENMRQVFQDFITLVASR